MIGASIAYHLLQDGLDGTVGILEKDPSYEFASTPRSLGGIRQQFSTEVNINACLYSVAAFDLDSAKVDALLVQEQKERPADKSQRIEGCSNLSEMLSSLAKPRILVLSVPAWVERSSPWAVRPVPERPPLSDSAWL